GTTVTAIRFRRNASERLLPWPSSSPPPPPLPPQPASARASAVVTIARMVEPLLQVPVSLHERRAANDLGGGTVPTRGGGSDSAVRTRPAATRGEGGYMRSGFGVGAGRAAAERRATSTITPSITTSTRISCASVSGTSSSTIRPRLATQT